MPAVLRLLSIMAVCGVLYAAGAVFVAELRAPVTAASVAAGVLLAGVGVVYGSPSEQRALERERWEQGLCVKCGYDLRATPRRCPECGRKVGRGRGPRGPAAR
jgi:hypothetical protein